MAKTCSKCGAKIKRGSFCAACGKELEPKDKKPTSKKKCPKCDRIFKKVDFCSECGVKLEVIKKRAKSFRSVITGILAIILFFLPPLAFLLGLAAIILGVIDLKQNKKYAVGGLILGILAIIITVIIGTLGLVALLVEAQAPWYTRIW